MPWPAVQVFDLSEDGYFSLLTEEGDTRQDLKVTENCSPGDHQAIRDLIAAADASGERVIVSLLLSLPCSHF